MWLTRYTRLNMARLVNPNLIAFAENFYLQEFPPVHPSYRVYETYSFRKQKYFAPIGMLYNILNTYRCSIMLNDT